MLGNKLEQDILDVFDSDISVLLSINQISIRLNKAYPHINSKVHNLITEGVLSKANVGRSSLCSLNLENEKSVALLILKNSQKKEQALSKILNRELFIQDISKIKEEFKVHTILMNGKSLIFVLDYIHDREAIKNIYKNIKKFDLLFFDKASFKEYLMESPETITEFVVLYSYEKFFEFVSQVKGSLVSKKLFSESRKGNADGK